MNFSRVYSCILKVKVNVFLNKEAGKAFKNLWTRYGHTKSNEGTIKAQV